MTPYPWSDLAAIIGLILINGLFSMSELAIVSARPARLKVAAEKGSSGARKALELQSDPGKFLSTVQIGITLVAVIAGAYSGSSLGHPTAERLMAWGVPAEYADDAGFAAVIAFTTYLSVTIGELVPKQVALRHSEGIATLAALPMSTVAKVGAPLVWLLDVSSSLLLTVLRVKRSGENEVTAEELHMIIAEATNSGVIEEDERAIMTGIMRLADRPVRELMTPRNEIDTIDRRASEEDVRALLKTSPHSLWPVVDGAPDNVCGVVKVLDLQRVLLAGKKVQVARLMRKAEILPDQLDAMDALKLLQQSDVSMAMVHDEYGHLEGIVTPADLLSAIVGQFASHQDEGDEPMIVMREDGSLLLSGALPVDALGARLGIEISEDRDYATAAGFVLSVLKRLPHEGEHFQEQGWRIEIVDMDGRRIDKLLASKVEAAPAAQ